MRQLSIIEFSAALVASSVEEFTLGVLFLPLSSVFVGEYVDTDCLTVFVLTFFCVSVCMYVDALPFSLVFDPTSNVGVAIRILIGALSVLLAEPDISLKDYHTPMTLIDRRICSLSHDASYLIPVPVRLPNATHTLYLVIYRVDE